MNPGELLSVAVARILEEADKWPDHWRSAFNAAIDVVERLGEDLEGGEDDGG